MDMQKDGFLSVLSSGGYGLGKTVWLFGVLPSFVLNMLSKFAPYEIGLLLMGGVLGYLFFLVPGIWRAADKYNGSVVGAALAAKIYAVISVVAVGMSLATIVFLSLQ